MPESKKYIPVAAIVEVSIREESESWLAQSLDPSDNLPRFTKQDIKEHFVLLKDAQEALGFAHRMYARQRVRSADLEGVKVMVGNSPRWLVTRESIEAYKTRQVRRGAERNFTLRIDPSEEAKVRRLLEQGEVEYSLELTYVKKAKKVRPVEAEWAQVILELDED